MLRKARAPNKNPNIAVFNKEIGEYERPNLSFHNPATLTSLGHLASYDDKSAESILERPDTVKETEPDAIEADDDVASEKHIADESRQRVITLKRWVPLAQSVADKKPEPKYLADRRPGLLPLYTHQTARIGQSASLSQDLPPAVLDLGAADVPSYSTAADGAAITNLGQAARSSSAVNASGGAKRRPPPPPPKRRKRRGIGRARRRPGAVGSSTSRRGATGVPAVERLEKLHSEAQTVQNGNEAGSGIIEQGESHLPNDYGNDATRNDHTIDETEGGGADVDGSSDSEEEEGSEEGEVEEGLEGEMSDVIAAKATQTKDGVVTTPTASQGEQPSTAETLAQVAQTNARTPTASAVLPSTSTEAAADPTEESINARSEAEAEASLATSKMSMLEPSHDPIPLQSFNEKASATTNPDTPGQATKLTPPISTATDTSTTPLEASKMLDIEVTTTGTTDVEKVEASQEAAANTAFETSTASTKNRPPGGPTPPSKPQPHSNFHVLPPPPPSLPSKPPAPASSRHR